MKVSAASTRPSSSLSSSSSSTSTPSSSSSTAARSPGRNNWRGGREPQAGNARREGSGAASSNASSRYNSSHANSGGGRSGSGSGSNGTKNNNGSERRKWGKRATSSPTSWAGSGQPRIENTDSSSGSSSSSSSSSGSSRWSRGSNGGSIGSTSAMSWTRGSNAASGGGDGAGGLRGVSDDRNVWNQALFQIQQMMRDRSNSSKQLDSTLDQLLALSYPNRALSSDDCDAMVLALGNVLHTTTDSDLLHSKVCQLVQHICLKQKAALRPKTLKVLIQRLLDFIAKGAKFFEHEVLKTLGAVLLDHADACMSLKSDILAVLLSRAHPSNSIVKSRREAVTSLYYFCMRGAKKLKTEHPRIYELLQSNILHTAPVLAAAADPAEASTSQVDTNILQILNSSLGAANHILQLGELATTPAFAVGLPHLVQALDTIMAHAVSTLPQRSAAETSGSVAEPAANKVQGTSQCVLGNEPVAISSPLDPGRDMDNEDDSACDDSDDDEEGTTANTNPDFLRRSIRCQVMFLIETISKRARSFSAGYWTTLLQQRRPRASRKYDTWVKQSVPIVGGGCSSASWRGAAAKPKKVVGSGETTPTAESHLVLNRIMMHDPSPKVRAAALTAIGSVIAAAPLPFWIPKPDSSSDTSITNKPGAAGQQSERQMAVRGISVAHSNLLAMFRREKSARVLLQLVKTCSVLIQNVPYAHFSRRLLLDLMLMTENILLGRRPRPAKKSMPFSSASLAVVGSAISSGPATERTLPGGDGGGRHGRVARGPATQTSETSKGSSVCGGEAANEPCYTDGASSSTGETLYPPNLVAAVLATWATAFGAQSEALDAKTFLATPIPHVDAHSGPDLTTQPSPRGAHEQLSAQGQDGRHSVNETSSEPVGAFSFRRTVAVTEYPPILRSHLERTALQQNSESSKQVALTASMPSPSIVGHQHIAAPSLTRLQSLAAMLPQSSVLLSTVSMHCPQVVCPEWAVTIRPQILKMFRGSEDTRHAALLLVTNLVKGIHNQANAGASSTDATSRDSALLEFLPEWPEFLAHHLARSCQDASVKVRVAGMDCMCLFGDMIWSQLATAENGKDPAIPRANNVVTGLVEGLCKSSAKATAAVTTAICRLFGCLASCNSIRSAPWFAAKVLPFLLSCIADTRSKVAITVKASWALGNLCVAPPSITTVLALLDPPIAPQDIQKQFQGTSGRPHEHLRKMVNVLVDACQRSDKIVGTAMRGVGLLGEQICHISTVPRTCLTQLIDTMTTQLLEKNKLVAKGGRFSNETAKLVWNVCSAAERVLSQLSSNDANLASDALMNGLLNTVQAQQNFKVRSGPLVAAGCYIVTVLFSHTFSRSSCHRFVSTQYWLLPHPSRELCTARFSHSCGSMHCCASATLKE